MRFPKPLILRLSSSASGNAHSPIQVISVLVARFSSLSSSSTSAGSGSSSTVGFSSPRRLQQDEESRNVRVFVWWDFDNCNLPPDANVFKVAQAITAATRSSGIKGPIKITAFGDLLQLSRMNQKALTSTGINLRHVTQGVNPSVDKFLFIEKELMSWVFENPPPAHLFLISSDKVFASTLHRLRMDNYNILLASKAYAPGVLCSAATIMWDWFPLVKGENVTGRHFNHPPDGPCNSWYGQYRIPLQDPFAAVGQSNSVKTEEPSLSNSNLDSKFRPIPKEVVRQIRIILSFYPMGASIVELEAELSKNKVLIDRDFYGYKKFSRFLSSMPDILQVFPVGDEQFFVHAVTHKTPFQLNSSSVISTPYGQRVGEKKIDNAATVEARGDETQGNMHQNMAGSDKNVKQETQESDKSSREPVPVGKQDVEVLGEPMRKTILHSTPIVKDYSSEEDGFVKKLKILWFGTSETEAAHQNMVESDQNVKLEPQESEKSTHEPDDNSSEEDGFVRKLKKLWFGSSEKEAAHLPENMYVSEDGLKGKPVFDKGIVKNENIKSCSQEADTVTQLPPSTSVGSAEEAKSNTNEGNDKSKSPGFCNRIFKWFKFWERHATAAKLGDEPRGTQELVSDSSQMNEIFTKDSFWREIESFIKSSRGFIIISHSKTREWMARNLQKEGPSCLKPLSEPDMLHLVDVIIMEKKWVEENPSETLPFSLSLVARKSYGSDHSRAGFRSVFLDPQKSHSPQQGEKGFQNVAHAGVSVTNVYQKPSERSKNEIFTDCQNLVKKIIEKHPGGYNLGLFRKDFLVEYGYYLDIQKLGYYKLLSLMQLMPGVRIESGLILPSNSTPDASSLSGFRKTKDSDSAFEELGPEKPARKLPEYEPYLSEDSDSDSETEASSKEKDKMKKKQQQQDVHLEDRDSSLLEVLDSWYSSKEGDDKTEKVDNVEESTLTSVPGNNKRRQKPTKTYSFVADSHDNDDKEKLIDGILDSLKKSGETMSRDEVGQQSQ